MGAYFQEFSGRQTDAPTDIHSTWTQKRKGVHIDTGRETQVQILQQKMHTRPKNVFRASTGFEPVAFAFALQLSYEDPYTEGRPIQLRWSHIHFICIPAVRIPLTG